MSNSFKVGLVGREGIGKTSIVLRLVDDYFSRSFKPSTGVFRVDYNLNVHSQPVVLNVNDFPGKIDLESSFADTIKTLDAVLIVTDNNYNNEDSRNEMTILIEELRRLFAFKNPYFAIVGNLFINEDEEADGFQPPSLNISEIDKANRSMSPVDRVLSEESSEKIETIISSELTDGELITRSLAKTVNVDFYRVCAYNGYGILDMFECVAKKLVTRQQLILEKLDQDNTIPLNKPKRYSCFCIPRKD